MLIHVECFNFSEFLFIFDICQTAFILLKWHYIIGDLGKGLRIFYSLIPLHPRLSKKSHIAHAFLCLWLNIIFVSRAYNLAPLISTKFTQSKGGKKITATPLKKKDKKHKSYLNTSLQGRQQSSGILVWTSKKNVYNPSLQQSSKTQCIPLGANFC